MFFDTHAHYDDRAFDADREALLERLHREEQVELILDPGCDLESSRAALTLAERFDFVYAAVGIHPEELAGYGPAQIEELRRLAAHPKCLAIGEIGLDYYWDSGHKEEQRDLFRRQIRLAIELCKPIVVHDREAHGDCLEIVGEYPEARGVFHCFSGSREMAEALLKRGWYLGFDGPVTYKNARKALEVLEICPMDRLLLETDSPYLSPVPMRGKRNHSGNLRYVAEKIGQVKGLSPEKVAAAARENGLRLFGLEGRHIITEVCDGASAYPAGIV